MDDFKLENLSEAKNEYCVRLINILSPLILQGLKSLFNEAQDLCVKNDEHSKYLMTFQNFLARVPKWNSTIIEEETNRIITKSSCTYLEDLITCVHIAQLKILTSIRVGQQQKKIELDIPKVSDFVHKIYIEIARKIYTNVYLFEDNIEPLNYQKNMRECEVLVKESILNVLRNNIPIEHILRSYIDETIEEDVEIQEEILEAPEEEKTEEEKTEEEKTEEEKTEEETEEEKTDEKTEEEKTDEKTESLITSLTSEESTTNSTPIFNVNTETTNSSSLSFSDVDKVLNMETNQAENIQAPKTIERLEEISNIRNEQRRLDEQEEEEEEEEENDLLKIGQKIHLDTLDVHNLNKGLQLKNKPLLTGVQVLN
tara:strand:- start:321 stop:1430 length:1110 start_codon:yes stop_codon:yes gene_type:complete